MFIFFFRINLPLQVSMLWNAEFHSLVFVYIIQARSLGLPDTWMYMELLKGNTGRS